MFVYGLPNNRGIHHGMFEDLTSVEVLLIDWLPDGGLRVEFAEDLPPNVVEAVERRLQSINAVEETLRIRARDAIQTNRDFLGLAVPTNAQVLAHVRFLSRAVSGLIRLVLRRLDTTD